MVCPPGVFLCSTRSCHLPRTSAPLGDSSTFCSPASPPPLLWISLRLHPRARLHLHAPRPAVGMLAESKRIRPGTACALAAAKRHKQRPIPCVTTGVRWQSTTPTREQRCRCWLRSALIDRGGGSWRTRAAMERRGRRGLPDACVGGRTHHPFFSINYPIRFTENWQPLTS